ncbi:RrF2 family transcriptional regulator [Alkalilacustris brevis]|uniref:RrF2 family transcriptional regulator n=1 Tax=Alkalilacustris brevis TaxID=2026338 RepID=UPI000E0CBF8A|nr:Rrf2 family transcriptional regulator [Alkalilacustris brevis]
MRLTKFSDYALRTLLYAASKGDRLATIEETAQLYGISQAHLKKVVLTLTQHGILSGRRGRSGGFTLARPPEAINLGEVLRATEPDFGMVECFLAENSCAITRACKLPPVINEALAAFISVFDRYTLADMLIDPQRFATHSATAQPRRGPYLPARPDEAESGPDPDAKADAKAVDARRRIP